MTDFSRKFLIVIRCQKNKFININRYVYTNTWMLNEVEIMTFKYYFKFFIKKIENE